MTFIDIMQRESRRIVYAFNSTHTVDEVHFTGDGHDHHDHEEHIKAEINQRKQMLIVSAIYCCFEEYWYVP